MTLKLLFKNVSYLGKLNWGFVFWMKKNIQFGAPGPQIILKFEEEVNIIFEKWFISRTKCDFLASFYVYSQS